MIKKTCRRKGCKGLVRRKDTVYCSRRCGFINRKPAVGITINDERGSMPKVEKTSWWTKPETFYNEARKLG